MTQVASLELCKELYELSGWKDTKSTYKRLVGMHDLKWKEWYLADYNNGKWSDVGERSIPGYDLGYLLRRVRITLIPHTGTWNATYERGFGEPIIASADTPEDAAAKLCIKLFNKGILSKLRKDSQ